ncbi:MAG: MFS transporter [Anaerolineaceae bacterium]|nr:MFS transporter [Anaerolineaceae bacterium]MDD4042522.1 MFS transporter [Anaerolineaceae bacterium]
MKSEKLKTFNYSIGMFGTSIPINLLKTFAFAYYVDTLGVTTAQWASIMLIYTFIDAADNLVYGYLSDRTRTRWGRRRPWLVIGTPLLVLGLILFYSTPAGLEGNQLYIYAMLLYIFTGTLDSVINANYGALFPELFTTDASRAKANALRQAFQLVAMIISIALTPMVVDAIGWSATAIIYGVLGGAVILYMALTSHEKPVTEDEKKPQLWDSVKTLLTNRKFWVAGITNAFYSAGMSLVLAGLPIYAKYSLGIGSGQQSLLFGAVLLVAIAAVALWANWVKKYDLVKVWRASIGILALSYIPLFFANSFVTALVCAMLVGFGFAGVITTMDLIHSRIMDEDQAKHNVRREGIISNALGFMNRLNGLFTSVAYALLGVMFGYVSGEVPGPQPDMAARFLLTVFPFVMMVLSFGVSFLSDFEPVLAGKRGEGTGSRE